MLAGVIQAVPRLNDPGDAKVESSVNPNYVFFLNAFDIINEKSGPPLFYAPRNFYGTGPYFGGYLADTIPPKLFKPVLFHQS